MTETPNHTESIFAAAVALAIAEERAAYLDQACAGDAALRGRVEALLRAHERAGHLLDRPVPRGPEETRDYIPREQPGAVIAGRYKLLEAIGEGGMGTVWVAEQTQPVRRKVALKLIKAGMDSKSVLARFEAERQALAVMDHPNIAKVLDGGLTETGRPFFVMEYVKGVPITEYCDATRLSVPERLNLFVQVCQAVQHAHQKGIIHRDLKPSNILVAPYDDKPVPKVIDFGLAKAMHQSLTERTLHTAHETVLGTPLYMSPEQAQLNNLDVDTRSDIYSLGVLLYELLTGTTPLEKQRFKEAAWDEIKRIIREEEPPRPSTRLSSSQALPSLAAGRHSEPARLTKLVRGELDWIVMKSLEKDRSRRYDTANGFAMDIQRHLAGEPVLAAPPSARYRLRKFVRRNRGQVIAGSLVLLALLGGMIGTSIGLVRADSARRAEAEQRAAADRARDGEKAEREKAEGLADDMHFLAIEERDAKNKAEQAAAAEKAANAQAQKRLTQIEKGNAILTSIFDDLNIQKVKESGEPLEAVLAKRLVKAASQLEGDGVGDPLVVAGLQHNLGLTLLTLGFPHDASALFQKARITLKGKLGEDHLDTIFSAINLAASYSDAGKLDLALPLLEEILPLMKTKLGADHTETLAGMGQLALGYLDIGKVNLAVPILEETLRITKAKLGADHPDTLFSMNNLALAYGRAGKHDLALPLHEETLKLRKANLGADHPVTLSSMGNLAKAYHDAGKLDLAIPLLEETLRLQKAKLGPDHPNTLLSMGNLAAFYDVVGKYDLALPLYEETLRLRKAKLGPDHPNTISSMNNLAQGYWDAGKPDVAMPLFEETLKLAETKLGPEHPHTLLCAWNLGHLYQDSGMWEQSLPLLKLNLANARKTLPKDSPELAGNVASLCVSLIQTKAFTEAEPLLRECLVIREKTEPDAWSTFNTKAMLGGTLLGQKKYTDAEPLLLVGYEGMRKQADKIPKNGRARLTEALDRLIELYQATNKPDEVKKWRAERAKYPEAGPKPGEKK